METNAFNEKYFKERLDFFNNRIKTFSLIDNKYLTETGEDYLQENDIKLKYKEGGITRLDGYLYADFREWTNFPMLLEKNTLWMSITPMEISSHYMPIELAKGIVGVAGLGLGYYIESIKDKKEVKKIIVFEQNKDIINLYLKNFGENEKVQIVNMDIRKIEGYKFDFFYNDIYEDMLPLEIAEDYQIIMDKNEINIYWFWGLERFILSNFNRLEEVDFPSVWILRSIELYEMLEQSDNNKFRIYPERQLFEEFSVIFD